MKITINRRDKKTPAPLNRRLDFAKSPIYPKAVEDAMLVGVGERYDADMRVRARMVFDVLMPGELAGKSVREWSGEIYMEHEAASRGATSVPPHDYILMYDVLDHCVATHPRQVLEQAKAVLAPDGAIIVRCHPWLSRHATHLGRDFNKAYAHLLFSEGELAAMGYAGRPTRRDTASPLETYRSWFTAAGLAVRYEEPVVLQPEHTFRQPQVLALLGVTDPAALSVQFVDYIVGHAKV